MMSRNYPRRQLAGLVTVRTLGELGSSAMLPFIAIWAHRVPSCPPSPEPEPASPPRQAPPNLLGSLCRRLRGDHENDRMAAVVVSGRHLLWSSQCARQARD
jgi:hypothetical protein